MRKLIIPVKKWLHGRRDSERSADSYLLRPSDDKMCCMGIYLSACGMSDQALRGMASPEDVEPRLPDEAKWLEDRDIVAKLMELNDICPVRSKIAKIFREHGVEIEFQP